MTAIRKAISFAKESSFASGTPVDTHWYAFPPGTFLSNTGARQAESLYQTGSKVRAATAYGYFGGTWNLSFVFDYNYLEPFEMVYEYVNGSPSRESYIELSELDTIKPTGTHAHYFEKVNSDRVKSFCIRMFVRNEIAGGEPDNSDEMTILKGCVAKSINWSRSAADSKLTVEISGVYADQVSQIGVEIPDDAYHAYEDVDLAQYSCMYVDELDSDDAGYIYDIDSHSITHENNVSLVYNTCSPIATAYSEGQSVFSWNAQTYSNDPKNKFKLRPNSGGKDSTTMSPAGKGLAPMAKAWFVTYSDSMRDHPEIYASRYEALAGSTRSVIYYAIDSTVKSMTWQKGDGSKMMDALSSVECTNVIMRVLNGHEGIWMPSHRVGDAEYDSAYDFEIDGTTGTMYSGKKIVFTIPENFNGMVYAYKSYNLGDVISSSDPDLVCNGYKFVPATTQSKATSTQPAKALTNIEARQLVIDAAHSNTGLTISNSAQSGSTNVHDKITVSGTASYIGTDYYFIVKPKDTPITGTSKYEVDAIGYMRIDVRKTED